MIPRLHIILLQVALFSDLLFPAQLEERKVQPFPVDLSVFEGHKSLLLYILCDFESFMPPAWHSSKADSGKISHSGSVYKRSIYPQHCMMLNFIGLVLLVQYDTSSFYAPSIRRIFWS